VVRQLGQIRAGAATVPHGHLERVDRQVRGCVPLDRTNRVVQGDDGRLDLGLITGGPFVVQGAVAAPSTHGDGGGFSFNFELRDDAFTVVPAMTCPRHEAMRSGSTRASHTRSGVVGTSRPPWS
jgi:hypothetical protein